MTRDDFLVRAESLVLSPFRDAAPFDFSLRRGEHWLLRGPSHAGKTPFLKTLVGLLSPAAGRVVLFGQDVQQLAPAALLGLRRRLGVVFALDGLLPAWTGFENLALPLVYHDRASGDEVARRVAAAAARYGVPAAWLDDPVGALAAEKRGALALIRALLVEPELLVVDGVALDALAAFSGLRADVLLGDAVDGRCTLLLSLPADEAGRLPGALAALPFRAAEMRDGRLECAD